MEFNEKLQILRKRAGLTQEELADALYVSRAAVSKWESGRGYPNIDSLKAIAKLFSVTVDELLSGEELLSVAQEDSRQKETCFQNRIFGLLDCGYGLFFFLPFFGQETDGIIREVSLLALTQLQPWLKYAFLAVVLATVAVGIATLVLRSSPWEFWLRRKNQLSLLCNVAAAFLFILSRQPYAAAFAVCFLIVKALLLIKKP